MLDAGSILSLIQTVALAEIGYPEAKTYDTSHNSLLGIMFIGIGICALAIFIGLRAKQEQTEQPTKASPF